MPLTSQVIARKKRKTISPKAYWREVLAVIMLLLAILFFRGERKELQLIVPHIRRADPSWVFAGFFLTLIYFLLHGGLYRKCFAAIGLSLPWANATVLFLKRNFISVFLPAGGVSSLAYSPSEIRKQGYNKTQVHQASGLFGAIGLLTVFLAGLPVILFSIIDSHKFSNALPGLFIVLSAVLLLVWIILSVKQKGKFYQWLDKKWPSVTPALDELFAANIIFKKLYSAVVFSLGVELCGMLHIYIAMRALGFPVDLAACATTYIITVLLMIVSPFLRGLGAVEISMVYVLQQFGYTSMQAFSITILYRLFEFWLPLIAGFFAFAWKGRKIFLRLVPAVLTFALGIVNIISVVTPPDRQRLGLLKEYLPLGTIHASNLLILFVGVSLVVTAAYLFRGLRNAWTIALVLAVLSFIGNISKALDYEEAMLAAFTITILIFTASQYRIRSSNKWMQAGFKTALLSFAAVILVGFTSFYFVEKKHFTVDFSWQQSLVHTLKSFLLVTDDTLHPATRFGHEIIWVIRIAGLFTWGFLIYTLIRPYIHKQPDNEPFRQKARFLLGQFGNSSADYFKLYKDKLYFFSDQHEAFIAYRIANNFAIVLEEPVCADENKTAVLIEFERHCRKMGLKTAFYRVDENSVPWFNRLRKKKLLIGQEAILELDHFTLEGKDKKSLRNGLNSLQKKGFSTTIHRAPHNENFIALLKKISAEWLESFQKKEFIFSQGMFDEKEIMQQDIIALHDTEGNIKAFLNIIPDYAEDECTYDLIRKTNDAPAAAMDALIIKLLEYAKEKGLLYVNLGMVPMTGITEPDNTAEQMLKLAASKIKRFHHYRGLREFKEKYATLWENKYLIYTDDFDLLQLPVALNNVMKA